MDIEINGHVAPGFEGVREEFAAAVAAENGESGAQLAVVHSGRRVVDLWAGEDVTGDTLTGIYSSTKGAATLVIALLVQDGVLGLDRPVAEVWPEFGVAGKQAITLRDILSHRSGIVGVDDGATSAEFADDQALARRLARQRPHWKPGSAYGYSGFVGFAMANEVVRRITGHSIQHHFEQRVRAPHDLDVYLGLPEELEHRYLPVRPWLATPEQEAAFWSNVPGPQSILGIAYGLNTEPPLDQVEFINSRHTRALGQASAGGVASARGLAAMYAAAISEIDGRAPLLTTDTVGEFAMLHSTGGDLVGGADGEFALGFEAISRRYPFLSARAFGHDGSAGSLGFADPHLGLAVGYTRRRFAFAWTFPEHARLTAAIHAACDLVHVQVDVTHRHAVSSS